MAEVRRLRGQPDDTDDDTGDDTGDVGRPDAAGLPECPQPVGHQPGASLHNDHRPGPDHLGSGTYSVTLNSLPCALSSTTAAIRLGMAGLSLLYFSLA